MWSNISTFKVALKGEVASEVDITQQREQLVEQKKCQREATVTFDQLTLEKVYELVKDEYDAEIQRFSGYEVRTGILFAVAAALFPVMLHNFHVPRAGSGIIEQAILYFSEVMSVLSAVYASVRFFLLLRARPVKRISTSEWQEVKYLGLDYVTCLLTLIRTYNSAIVETRKQTQIRTTHFQHGLMSLGIAIIAALFVIGMVQI